MTEYEVVKDGGAGLIDLSAQRGRIRVNGSEATMFLNGLITNDVKNLAQNRWMPAVFPTVQGRLIGAVRVIRGSDPSFLIDTETTSHDAVLKTISRFTPTIRLRARSSRSRMSSESAPSLLAESRSSRPGSAS